MPTIHYSGVRIKSRIRHLADAAPISGVNHGELSYSSATYSISPTTREHRIYYAGGGCVVQRNGIRPRNIFALQQRFGRNFRALPGISVDTGGRNRFRFVLTNRSSTISWDIFNSVSFALIPWTARHIPLISRRHRCRSQALKSNRQASLSRSAPPNVCLPVRSRDRDTDRPGCLARTS